MRKHLLFIIISGLYFYLFAENITNFIKELPAELSGWEVYSRISGYNEFQSDGSNGFSILENVIDDTTTAYSQLWIPDCYDPRVKTPLIIFLHGGISTAEFVPKEDLLKYSQENILWEKLKDSNYIFLFPTGKMGLTWWEKDGMENLTTQIRLLKQEYNIDDNRICMTGISDGGSGSYHFAMNKPDDFAAFLPMIGMISVGSLVNQQPVFISNLQNRPIYATNTDKDGLYPAEQMRKLIALSQQAGSDILYKEFFGFGHEVSYLDKEVDFQIDYIESRIRDPFPTNIYWETEDPYFGKCDWLEITGIDTNSISKSWQIFHNTKLLNTRLLFGFNNDRKWEGEGVKVSMVSEDSAAEECGLKIDDLIVALDDNEIKEISELIELRDTTKKHGSKFSLTVLRNDEKIVLNGQFHEQKEYSAIFEKHNSGAVMANYFGNRFIIEASKVTSLSIYVHPQMVNFDNPVIIEIDGEVVFEQKVEFDRDFLIRNFIKNYDRKALWCNKIDLKL